MTTIMNASETKEITDGQIENAVNKLRDAMRTHRSEIASDVAQQVLGVENLGMMMFTPFRERAEAVSNMISRRVLVIRTREPQAMLDATARKQYTDQEVVNSMPKGEGEEPEEVIFFKPRPEAYDDNGLISDDNLEKEFEFCGLRPDCPYSLATVNAAEPAFADSRPNGTHWKDANGKWCFAAFSRWSGERRVIVSRNDVGWNDIWWFAGLRK